MYEDSTAWMNTRGVCSGPEISLRTSYSVKADLGLEILCFDDSEAVLSLMTLVLTARGHRVHTAQTVREAAAVVASCDLVVIDFHMPQIEAADTLRLLRSLARGAGRTLFYLYTSDTSIARTFKELGYDGAFSSKGEITLLPAQVDVAARRLRLRQLKGESSG